MTVSYLVINNKSVQRVSEKTQNSDVFQDEFLHILNQEKSRNKNFCANSVIQAYQHLKNQFSNTSDIKNLKQKLVELYQDHKISKIEFKAFDMAIENEILKNKIRSTKSLKKPQLDLASDKISQAYPSQKLREYFDERIHFANPCLEREYLTKLKLHNLHKGIKAQHRSKLLKLAYKEGFLNLEMYTYLSTLDIEFKALKIAKSF